nr:hypothetical protein [uncultured Cellulosilyticum sp.]
MKDYYMNNVLLHNFLQELNSISRMAVIENAFTTEKMINIYSHLLKYRWNEVGKKVTATKEMNMVLKCCELFKLKNEALIDYTYIENGDITTVFIPHYTMVAYIKGVLSVTQGMMNPLKLHIEVSQRKAEIWIQFFFTGQVNFKEIVEKADYLDNGQDYESFSEATKRWQETFKEDSFKIAIQENQLEICFVCR